LRWLEILGINWGGSCDRFGGLGAGLKVVRGYGVINPTYQCIHEAASLGCLWNVPRNSCMLIIRLHRYIRMPWALKRDKELVLDS
jgi:hypothetical protein